MKLPRLFGCLVLCGLFVSGLRAAEFEGTVKWNFTTEITDPQLKAKIVETQKQLADPAKLAQMKAMLANPQMKATLEQNPQMRAAMEAQIKLAEDAIAGKGGDLLTAMMPRAMTIRAKGGKSHLTAEGGAMSTEVITTPEPPSVWLIDRKGRTFSKLPPNGSAKAAPGTTPYKVVKSASSSKILGYECQEYLVELTKDGRAVRNRLWATTGITGVDGKALVAASFGGEEATYLKEIEGVPLKMELTMPQIRLSMLAAAVTAGAVSDEEFVVPAGFVEKPLTSSGPSK